MSGSSSSSSAMYGSCTNGIDESVNAFVFYDTKFYYFVQMKYFFFQHILFVDYFIHIYSFFFFQNNQQNNFESYAEEKNNGIMVNIVI